MAFRETIGTITDNIGKKANNAMEVSKINGKINAELKNISELKLALGEYCFEQYSAGKIQNESVIFKCEAIKAAENKIHSMKAEIKGLKEAAPKRIIPKKEPIICPNCGVEMKPDMKFCGICGRELKMPEPPPEMDTLDSVPEGKLRCQSCGETWDSKLVYCGKCGEKLRA